MDFVLYQQLIVDFLKKHKCSDPRDSARSNLRMLDALEKTRKNLTMNKETDIDVEAIIDDIDLHKHITR
jgi:molecular chaperone DnaK (HSP70)